jgi:hypothetical protein
VGKTDEENESKGETLQSVHPAQWVGCFLLADCGFFRAPSLNDKRQREDKRHETGQRQYQAYTSLRFCAKYPVQKAG